MHSGLILFLWLALVAAVQLLTPAALVVALAGTAALALWLARARSIRLVRRIRLLLLAIVVLFAGFTPGEAVLHDWPRISPTREGLELAAVHAARLLTVVFAVALLLERLSMTRLVAGLYALAQPLRVLGLVPERLAIRLLLVLHYVEASPRGSGRMQWRAWLQDEGQAGGEAVVPGLATVVLQRERIGALDALVMMGAGVALLWWSVA